MQLPSLKVSQDLTPSRLIRARFMRRASSGLLMALWLVLWAALTSCGAGAPETGDGDRELIVFAAASLAEAFSETVHQFELNNPGVTVVLNLAGSQQLAHQLSQGAPADVFASADEEQMEAAVETGRVESGSEQIFANNRLALIFPADNPAGLRTLSDLARPGLKLVLAAPAVPAGHYAALFLDAASADPGFGPIFRDSVLANVVSYEENVRAVLSKVRLGEADAGIVYASDVEPKLADGVGRLTLPEYLNVQAGYSIAPLANSEQPDLARAFIDFILSSQGQGLLRENGFAPVANS